MPRRPRPELKRVVPIVRREKVRITEALPPATWRIINSGASDGATNMAIDEAIVSAVSAEHAPPTLRFYQWNPPCLSLGRHQKIEEVDRQKCEQLGYSIVRRTTGGRAVLHIDELTYSIIAPAAEARVAGGVLESYRRLSAGLLRGLRHVKIEPERSQAYYDDQGVKGAACFDGPSDYEITVGQRKLIGSAQARLQGVVLQHGAIPLIGDITRIVNVLNVPLGEKMALRARLHYRATTVADAAGRFIEADELSDALSNGFADALNLQFEEDSLSAAEQKQAERIRAEKYANPEWTLRQ